MTTLNIYMKSGNKIRLPWVSEWGMTVNSNSVESLRIVRHWISSWLPGEVLVVQSIDLSQIEAVTVE